MLLRILAIILFNLSLIKLIAVAAGPYYVDLVAGACAGTYSIANRDCTGTDGVSYATTSLGSTAVAAGETIYIRQRAVDPATAYTTNLSMGSKVGTPAARITVMGYPGDALPIFRPSTNVNHVTGAIGMSYIKFLYLRFEGSSAQADNVGGFADSGGNNYHDIEFGYTEWQGVWRTAIAMSHSGYWIHHNKICGVTSRAHVAGTNGYGVYNAGGNGNVIEYNEICDNVGGGIQNYPNSPNSIIRYNYIHDNNTWPTINNGCIVVGNSSHGAQVYGNLCINNGSHPDAGSGHGISSEGGVDNVLIANNTIIGNKGIGIWIKPPPTGQTATGWVVINNYVIQNGTNMTLTGGTGVTNTTNRTTGVPGDCLVDFAGGDYRMKQGANSCRGAGTALASRPSPVGSVDQGAYEQGSVSSCAVVDGFIDCTVAVMTPGVLPTSGITGFTVANGTSTGTPVVASASVKAGSNNIVRLTMTGFSGSGTCTVSLGSTNMTDSLKIGGEYGTAQGVNSVSNLAVTGTCTNSAGGAAPGTPTIHHTMNEGAGTSLADEEAVAGGDQPSTLSGSPTWTTGIEGGGLAFASTQNQRGTFQYGNLVDVRSQSFTYCLWVKVDAGVTNTNRIPMGTQVGTDDRNYVGMHAATNTWALGVGTSGSSAAASEFPITVTWTRLCVINDATADVVTLAVNGTKGTSAGAVKSSVTNGLTTLTGNFLIGCGIATGTTNCGGFTVDEPKIWTSALSDAELLEDFTSYTPAGDPVACYAQGSYQAESVHLIGGVPVVKTLKADGSIDVVGNGAIAFRIDIKCTGSAGAPISVRPYYSTDGTTFTLPIPDTLGADGIAMWGDDVNSLLNSGITSGCVDGTGLTDNDGHTVLTSVTSPTVTLSQDHCTSFRIIVRFDDSIAGQSRKIRWKQDNGADLAGAYPATVPTVNVIPQQSSGVH